jgi:serine/threonine-protein kinase
MEIAHRVAVALKEAHSHGVLHLDLKPGNIMISLAGEVKVLDFGIARIVAPKQGPAKGPRVGTPPYMSPEQVRGDALDPRSDLYSFGCVLYELLTGRPPFTGTELNHVLDAHLNKEPAPPRTRNPEVPAEVEEIVLKCLQKAPAKRFPSALRLEAALAKLKLSVPVDLPDLGSEGVPEASQPGTTLRKWASATSPPPKSAPAAPPPAPTEEPAPAPEKVSWFTRWRRRLFGK